MRFASLLLVLAALPLGAQPLSVTLGGDASLRVVDTRSGFVWTSAPASQDAEDLNGIWADFSRSGISIDWYPAGALVTKRSTAASAGSKVTVTALPTGWKASVSFGGTGITVVLEVTVAGDTVRVRVPADGIEESAGNRVARVWLFPFLGAVRGADEHGYLVLPDGPGTLVPFRSAAPQGSEAWIKPVWGVDMADGSDPSWNGWDRIQWPVYGLVRSENQAAWVAELESGGELASIQAWPAGVTTGFTWLTASFQVRKTYVQPTARSGAGLTIVPSERQKTDLTIAYRFAAGPEATWLGLARRVQTAWAERLNRKPMTQTGLWNLTILGSASTGQLVGRGEIGMTNAEQARSIVREAAALARAPGQVILHGWQEGGEGWGSPTTNRTGQGFAGPGGLTGLVRDLKAVVPRVVLSGHLMLATDGNPDWSVWTDQAVRYNTTALRFTFEAGPALTLLNPAAIRDKGAVWSAYGRSLGAGLHLWDEGQLVSGWGGAGGGGRVKALEARKALFAALGTDLSLLDPGLWALPQTQSVVGFPLWSSGLRWGGASVPFLPNALRGLVTLYASDLNYSSNLKTDLLRLVDFGLGASVTVTAEPAWKLEMSALSVFSSTWSDWKPVVKDALAWIAPALEIAFGQTLVSRTEAGPVVTERFADGTVLTLDYQAQTWRQDRGGTR